MNTLYRIIRSLSLAGKLPRGAHQIHKCCEFSLDGCGMFGSWCGRKLCWARPHRSFYGLRAHARSVMGGAGRPLASTRKRQLSAGKIAALGAYVLVTGGCGMEPATDTESPSAIASQDATVEPPTPNDGNEPAISESGSDTLCIDMGPQTPRDIGDTTGLNADSFPLAPPAGELNLCNIHTHTNAEHRGPGFAVLVDNTDHGGYACNDTPNLSPAELEPAPGAYDGVEPGDTIEVHWVHTSCDATPGEGLGACVPEGCAEPSLRVEAQVFLVVNDPEALGFSEMAYDGNVVAGLHQAKMIPSTTGVPVQFRGSTTGPSYDQSNCSPTRVTWNVRPQCAKLDINSLHRWAEAGNVFNETKSHGVRQLVTAPELLSPIE